MKKVKIIALSATLTVLASGIVAAFNSPTAEAVRYKTVTKGPYSTVKACYDAKSKYINSSWTRVSKNCKYSKWEQAAGITRYYFDYSYVY